MDLKNKFLAGLFALALVTVSGCSSGQVDETGAPLESAGETGDQVAAEASTDAAPVGEDAGLDDPNAVAPPSDTVMADGAAPPADTVMATSEEPNLDTAPAPMTESGPVADAAPPADVSPLADAPPTANTNTEIPVDTATVAEPAPVANDTTINMAAATDTSAATDEDTGGKKKKKKKHGGAAMASGDGMNYQVRKGDTLMKIAFENYGDLYRWREIYEANRDKIQDPNHVPPGTELTLNGAGMVTIERNGEQYLIKHGDTLGTISKDVYGTPRKWKRLWENNRQLIKDPNKIYAGFYLYYQPDGKLTNDAGGGEDSAQNVQEAPAQEIVQQAQAPAQNVAAAQAQPAAPTERAPASAPAQAPAQPAAGQ